MPPESDPVPAGALTEREDELAALYDLVRRTLQDFGGVAVIAGPPGAGKTALLDAVRAYGDRSGVRDLHARGRELERDIGFGVAAGMLGPPVRAMPTDLRRSLLDELPEATLDVLEPTPASAAPRAPEQIVRALYWLTAGLCCPDEGTRDPLLLSVDDAHWSDAGTLQFLCHLADHVDEMPIGAVVATRDTAPSSLDRLAAHPRTVVVTPRHLSDGAVASLVRDRLPGAGEDLCRDRGRASGGNPFLLTELLRSIDVDPISADAVGRNASWARVHSGIPRFARSRAHRRAAGLLAVEGESPDAVAGHLLRTETVGDQDTVAMLETAAAQASARGDGHAVGRLLRRALAEPPSRRRYVALLTELALVQLRNADASAVRTGREALNLAVSRDDRSRAHDVLAQILIARGENEEATAQSAEALRLLERNCPERDDALARHLTAAAFEPGRSAEVRSWLAPLLDDARDGRPPRAPYAPGAAAGPGRCARAGGGRARGAACAAGRREQRDARRTASATCCAAPWPWPWPWPTRSARVLSPPGHGTRYSRAAPAPGGPPSPARPH